MASLDMDGLAKALDWRIRKLWARSTTFGNQIRLRLVSWANTSLVCSTVPTYAYVSDVLQMLMLWVFPAFWPVSCALHRLAAPRPPFLEENMRCARFRFMCRPLRCCTAIALCCPFFASAVIYWDSAPECKWDGLQIAPRYLTDSFSA